MIGYLFFIGLTLKLLESGQHFVFSAFVAQECSETCFARRKHFLCLEQTLSELLR